MAFRNAFCPNCGQPTQIDDTKEFCFCLTCGNKIHVPRREQPIIESDMTVTEHEPKQHIQEKINEHQNNQSMPIQSQKINEDKMKEVEFYYNLSREKKEYADLKGEPTYYLKGQDLLVDLSQQFPSDYRIWWELCKPMDFTVILSGETSNNPCTINNIYFDKALDFAPLEQKMELIRQHDKYLNAKNMILQQIQIEQKTRETQKRIRKEEEKRREEQERQEELKRQEKLKAEREQKALQLKQESTQLWKSLSEKDYSVIDNSYFQFNSPEGIPIIATLKMMANVLYLSAYHIDIKKNNQVYLNQSLAIHFGNDGTALKFDNRPVVVRGWNFPNNNIKIFSNLNHGCIVNDIFLYQDSMFIANISKNAKKPFVTFKKIFS